MESLSSYRSVCLSALLGGLLRHGENLNEFILYVLGGKDLLTAE